MGDACDACYVAEAGRCTGIYVANVPDYGVEEVADSTLSLILNLVRHTHTTFRSFLACSFVPSTSPLTIPQMRKTHVLANGTKENKWPTHAAKGERPLPVPLLSCACSRRLNQVRPGFEGRSWA
jgi:lactate dehydrogenase-like 2-hydroxyacid dehydrogenase